MKSNQDKLVIHAAVGEIAHPNILKSYWISYDGKPLNYPSVGSITYNYQIGDNCIDIVGDHVEPGVSIRNSDKHNNMTLNHLANIGNQATIISGAAKGEIGHVTGKHGGVDHVIIYFKEAILDKLVIGDKIQIKTFGLGLKLLDYPNVTVMNIDPNLLTQLEIEETKDNFSVAVAKVLPAHLLGAGIGSANMRIGDYDIMMFDEAENEKYNLNDLRFGDLIAIKDHYAEYGPHYKKDSLSIGIVVHGNSQSAGHGPGVVVIFTDKSNTLKYHQQADANIAKYLK